MLLSTSRSVTASTSDLARLRTGAYYDESSYVVRYGVWGWLHIDMNGLSGTDAKRDAVGDGLSRQGGRREHDGKASSGAAV